jgi:hypothetical protein
MAASILSKQRVTVMVAVRQHCYGNRLLQVEELALALEFFVIFSCVIREVKFSLTAHYTTRDTEPFAPCSEKHFE